jgi:CRP-like cAMP-binding protein
MVEHSAHDRLIAKLSSISNLSADDVQALRTLPMTIRRVEENADIVRTGERPTRCCLLVDGFLFTYIAVDNGARQITSLHVPGDLPDLQSLHLDVMDHSLGAISQSTVAFIPHAAVRDLAERHSGIASALWRETLVDAAIYREWITNVGARSAYQRTAHLLCEVFYKMKAVGLAAGGWCQFPLTQEEMGDAMGLSTVHVNRTLQQLRADGVIGLQHRRLTVPDWDVLKVAGGFDPTYLHVTRRPVR